LLTFEQIFVFFSVVCVCSSRSTTKKTLIEMMEFLQRLLSFCRKGSTNKCVGGTDVEQFARDLFIWRKPEPKFQRSKVWCERSCD